MRMFWNVKQTERLEPIGIIYMYIRGAKHCAILLQGAQYSFWGGMGQ